MPDRSPMPDIIVVLPGILGSVLTKNGQTVWGWSGKLLGTTLLTRGRTLRKNLLLQDDSPDDETLDDGIVAQKLIPDLHLLPGIWKIDGYSKLCTYIKSRFEVTEGLNFFEFPYDWRRDNRVAAQKLARLSHDWLKKWRSHGNSNAKLILVTHSMGGLVSRYFLEVLGGWKDTRALFSFGTPYRGSLNALDGLANGIRVGPLTFNELSDMARSFISIYQLLPIYPAYDGGDGKLVRIGETSSVPNLDAEKAKAALEFHKEIRSAASRNLNDPKTGVGYQIYPIIGIEQETKQSGRKVESGVELLTTYDGKILDGDGTVPHVSARPVEFDGVQPPPGRMYAATRHAALQNANATLVQLAGQIDDLYLNFGTFKSAHPVGPNVALQIDDLVTSDEPIQVRAKTNPPIPLTADLLDPDTDKPIQQLTLEESIDGWQHGTFEPAAAGYYRVRVAGAGVIQPAEDAVSVALAGASAIE